MNNNLISQFIYEVKLSFGERIEVSKVNLRTIEKGAFKVLTLMVKDDYNVTLVKLHMCSDGCMISKIVNLENSALEILFISKRINKVLEKLEIAR